MEYDGAGLAEARELLNDKTTKNSYRFSFLADGSASGPVLFKAAKYYGKQSYQY